jgi:hypothetical protein
MSVSRGAVRQQGEAGGKAGRHDVCRSEILGYLVEDHEHLEIVEDRIVARDDHGVIQEVPVKLLLVVTGSGQLRPCFSRIDADILGPQESPDQVDQVGMDGEEAQLDTREWRSDQASVFVTEVPSTSRLVDGPVKLGRRREEQPQLRKPRREILRCEEPRENGKAVLVPLCLCRTCFGIYTKSIVARPCRLLKGSEQPLTLCRRPRSPAQARAASMSDGPASA